MSYFNIVLIIKISVVQVIQKHSDFKHEVFQISINEVKSWKLQKFLLTKNVKLHIYIYMCVYVHMHSLNTF